MIESLKKMMGKRLNSNQAKSDVLSPGILNIKSKEQLEREEISSFFENKLKEAIIKSTEKKLKDLKKANKTPKES
jgi:pyrroline-5-carboxylate reductase